MTVKMPAKTIIAISAVFLLSGCQYIFWMRFRSDERKFSILLPRFWHRDTGGNPMVIISLREPLTGKGDTFQENINVAVSKVGSDAPQDLIYDINKDLVMNVLHGAKYDIVEEDKLAGKDRGRYLSFTLNNEVRKLRVTTLLLVKNSVLYVVTATCEEEKYKRYKKMFSETIASLRVQ